MHLLKHEIDICKKKLTDIIHYYNKITDLSNYKLDTNQNYNFLVILNKSIHIINITILNNFKSMKFKSKIRIFRFFILSIFFFSCHNSTGNKSDEVRLERKKKNYVVTDAKNRNEEHIKLLSSRVLVFSFRIFSSYYTCIPLIAQQVILKRA